MKEYLESIRRYLWNLFIGIGMIVTLVMGIVFIGKIFPSKVSDKEISDKELSDKSSNERKSSNYNMCMSTDTGKDYYRLGVRSGNEDSQVIRDCQQYWEDFVRPQLSSSEGNGIVTIGCFCSGYNSVSKSY